MSKKYEYNKSAVVTAMLLQVYVSAFAFYWLWFGETTTAEYVFLAVVAVLVTGKFISNVLRLKKYGFRCPTYD